MLAQVLCEQSGVWSSQLWAAGFEVEQFDLALPEASRTVADGWLALRRDVREVEPGAADVVIGFPPCTLISSVRGDRWPALDLYGDLALLAHVGACAAGARRAGLVENPRGLARRVLGRRDVEVHPWMYAVGESERVQKRTQLWLFGAWREPFMVGYCGVDDVPSFNRWSAFAGPVVRSKGWLGMARAFVDRLARDLRVTRRGEVGLHASAS